MNLGARLGIGVGVIRVGVAGASGLLEASLGPGSGLSPRTRETAMDGSVRPDGEATRFDLSRQGPYAFLGPKCDG